LFAKMMLFDNKTTSINLAMSGNTNNTKVETKSKPFVEKVEPIVLSRIDKGVQGEDGRYPPQIVLEQYSAKSIALFGETKPFRATLKMLHGRFNKNLRRGNGKEPGWIFSHKRTDEVKQWIDALNQDIANGDGGLLWDTEVPSKKNGKK
jgi:hypothetical protein